MTPQDHGFGALPPTQQVGSDASASALAEAVERVGDRWSLLIIHALLDGPARFNDLQERVSGVSPNILSQRLRRLEAEGIILASPYSQRPLRFTYELTARGRELAGALRLLAQWGARHVPIDDALRHDACGTPVEARWWCPTCNQPADHETTDLHHL
ncbi:MAG: helix-turn-helix transcriptional regulator [Actinomycetota bacterium]|nr:helix-turn-helix transcriptional regulator [Actinomycetota bacterium]